MQKYTLKQIDDMPLEEALEATKPGTYEIVPSNVPGEDAAVMDRIDETLESLKRFSKAVEFFNKKANEL